MCKSFRRGRVSSTLDCEVEDHRFESTSLWGGGKIGWYYASTVNLWKFTKTREMVPCVINGANLIYSGSPYGVWSAILDIDVASLPHWRRKGEEEGTVRVRKWSVVGRQHKLSRCHSSSNYPPLPGQLRAGR